VEWIAAGGEAFASDRHLANHVWTEDLRPAGAEAEPSCVDGPASLQPAVTGRVLRLTVEGTHDAQTNAAHIDDRVGGHRNRRAG
jgi:hypothetical protein